jgi:hypothetical protein
VGLLLVCHSGFRCIAFCDILGLTSPHRFVLHAFDSLFPNHGNEISFVSPMILGHEK